MFRLQEIQAWVKVRDEIEMSQYRHPDLWGMCAILDHLQRKQAITAFMRQRCKQVIRNDIGPGAWLPVEYIRKRRWPKEVPEFDHQELRLWWIDKRLMYLGENITWLDELTFKLTEMKRWKRTSA